MFDHYNRKKKAIKGFNYLIQKKKESFYNLKASKMPRQ